MVQFGDHFQSGDHLWSGIIGSAVHLFHRVSTWLGDQIRIPRVVITFFSFFPLPFPRRFIKDCKTVSSVYQLFVCHFTMAVLLCIYLHYRINKQRDTLFEFSSILLTVNLLKHLIMA